MRVLDACLEVLERANERGERSLSAELAQKLDKYLPVLKPGIALTEAMDLVFEAQSRRDPQRAEDPGKRQGHPLVGTDIRPTVDPEDLSAEEAKDLTAEIRSHARTACFLLYKAHDQRAWRALGYRSWAAYGRCEFGLSRARLYDLLEQAHVIRSLQTALGLRLEVAPDISPYAARDIRNDLDSVAVEVRRRLPQDPSQDQICGAVTGVVAEMRAARKHRQLRAALFQVSTAGKAGESEGAGPIFGRPAMVDVDSISQSIERFARLPPPSELVRTLSRDQWPTPFTVQRAILWLSQLSRELSEEEQINPALRLGKAVAS
jgi:hypothetical protein